MQQARSATERVPASSRSRVAADRSSTRLFVLIARGAEVAVIFRRGPSKSVLLVRWNLADDSFEAGQWLRGRIYERRCDLSPSGERLIYFAATHRPPFATWTAVSRPPYFTALALWPKGDAWGGGGLFRDENEILLNHQESALTLAEEYQIPREITVSRLPYGGGGEDDPIFSDRIARDGWNLLQEARWLKQPEGGRVSWTSETPEIWSKPHPAKSGWTLQMRTLGLHERQGPWYVTEYAVVDDAGRVLRDLGRADWADWQSSGDLLFGRDGKIFRDAMGSKGIDVNPTIRQLIDLSTLKFESREPVPLAMEWTGPRPRGVPIGASA